MNYYLLLTVFLGNLLLLSALPILIKFLLFCRARSFLGIKLFFTPGIVIRKETEILEKIDQALLEYHKFCLDKDSLTLSKVEKKLNNIIFQKTKFLQNYPFLPTFVCLLLRKILSSIVYQIVLQAGKEILPLLSNKYELEAYIQKIRVKIEPEMIEELSQKYFFRYLLYLFIALGFLMGITNILIICLI